LNIGSFFQNLSGHTGVLKGKEKLSKLDISGPSNPVHVYGIKASATGFEMVNNVSQVRARVLNRSRGHGRVVNFCNAGVVTHELSTGTRIQPRSM
jgi:hypothetical protein